jgi:inner membrane protein
LARGLFPRRSWRFVLLVVLAGTVADLDLLTLLVGPDAYLSGRFTVTHSILSAVIIAFLACAAMRWLEPKAVSALPALSATLLASSVHVLLDLSTSSGVAAWWPFRPSRFAWDLLPAFDPWILALLVAGILLPELFALVGSEIGAKEKSPHGRRGAIVALMLVVLYAGARGVLHGNAVAQLDAHSYRGESPKRIAAFPDTLSLTTWHGVAETTAQICSASVPATEGTRFDPESAACVHKPQASAALALAEQTTAATRFLQAGRFPKASVGATDDGSEVAIRDMRDMVEGGTKYALGARILLDRKGQLTTQGIVWARTLRLR